MRITIIAVLALLKVSVVSSTLAAEEYRVLGGTRGFFCSYYFFCEFKSVSFVQNRQEYPSPLPRRFSSVSEFKQGSEGNQSKCWIKTKTDESSLGWWALIWDWWNDAPIFFDIDGAGELIKLGSPEFIVFDCQLVGSPLVNSWRKLVT